MAVAEEDAVFRALAHPVRREILNLLLGGRRSVRELTAEFEMSQPAVSQHLRELREAGLVEAERAGQEQRYGLTAAPLEAVAMWVGRYRRVLDPAGHVWQLQAGGRRKADDGD